MTLSDVCIFEWLDLGFSRYSVVTLLQDLVISKVSEGLRYKRISLPWGHPYGRVARWHQGKACVFHRQSQHHQHWRGDLERFRYFEGVVGVWTLTILLLAGFVIFFQLTHPGRSMSSSYLVTIIQYVLELNSVLHVFNEVVNVVFFDVEWVIHILKILSSWLLSGSSSSSILAATKSSSVGVSPGQLLNNWAQKIKFSFGWP